MSDLTVSYCGNTIAELSDSDTVTLETSGKYLQDDLSVVYEKPVGVEQIQTVTTGANNCSRLNECFTYLLSLVNLNFPTKYIIEVKAASELTTPNAILNHSVRFDISNTLKKTYYKRYRNNTVEEGFINTVQEADFASTIAEGTTYVISLIELEE